MGVPGLETYRQLIQLDSPFRPGPPARDDEEASSFVRRAVRYLETEGVLRQLASTHAKPAEDDIVGQRRRLRALLTVRPADPLPDDVHAWIGAVLEHERRTLVRTDAADLAELWQGDITTLSVDAIVNAANDRLLGCFRPFHACIDNAIHSAAGPRLREDCARIMALQVREPTGVARATRGYHLPARFVLHTVGPIVRGRLTEDHTSDLASCYRSCLDLAAEVGAIRTLAFCAISTGVFGFPKREAANIALQTTTEWLAGRPNVFTKVIFNVFSDEDRLAYEEALAARRH